MSLAPFVSEAYSFYVDKTCYSSSRPHMYFSHALSHARLMVERAIQAIDHPDTIDIAYFHLLFASPKDTEFTSKKERVKRVLENLDKWEDESNQNRA